MKKIIKSIALIAAASLVLACNKEAPSKAEVESGFTPVKVTLPTLSLGSDVVCDALNGKAVVTVTIANLDPTLDSLSVGVIASADSTFATSSFTAIESPADGTVNVQTTVSANKTYFFRAVAACTAGSVYSEAVKVAVPDIPFWSKIPGAYKGSVVSAAYGDKYDNVITIFADATDKENTCYIQHLEPYYYGKYAKYRYPSYFFAKATIDNDAKTLTIAVGESYNYGTVAIVGMNNAAFKSATGTAPLVFKAVDDDTLLQVNAFCPYSLNEDSGEMEAEDAYDGNVTYKR